MSASLVASAYEQGGADAAIGGAYLLALLFGLSVVDNVRLLSARAARWHPVLSVPGYRTRYASTLLSFAATANVIVVVGLIVVPPMGGLGALLLVVAYAGAAISVDNVWDGSAMCRCFGRLFDVGGRLLLVRNGLLAGIAMMIVWWGGPARLPLRPLAMPWSALFGVALWFVSSVARRLSQARELDRLGIVRLET